jgi:hypothetical protein
MVERRLDSQERAEIQVGNIYVWEERGALDLSGMGIERWHVHRLLCTPDAHPTLQDGWDSLGPKSSSEC